MATTRRRFVAIGALLVTLAVLAGCGSDSAAQGSTDTTVDEGTTVPPSTPAPKSVTIDSSSPYYVAAKALFGAQVQAGTVVGGCTINAYTKCPGAELAGQYLQGAFLAYSDLRGANLSKVNLLQADLAFATLDGADLSGTQINATSTTKASFRDANLTGSQWVLVAGADTDFSGADLKEANFTSAQLTSSTMRGADLTGANLALADLTGVDLADAKLDDVNFCQTTMPDGSIRNPQSSAESAIAACGNNPPSTDPPLELTPINPYFTLALIYDAPFVAVGTTVGGCRLEPRTTCKEADLARQELTGAVLPYSRVQGANFSGSDMDAVVLDLAEGEGAELRDITFVGGSMANGHFRLADLSGAQLVFASLNGADLRDAKLVKADLSFGSIVGADASGADLTGVQLPDSNANGTNFSGANLSGANLTNADLTGANLDGANLDGATFCNTLMPDATVRNPVKGLCPDQ